MIGSSEDQRHQLAYRGRSDMGGPRLRKIERARRIERWSS